MAEPLTAYARLLLRNRDDLLARLSHPVLVWETSPSPAEPDDRAWATQAAQTWRRPKVGDPLVLEVRRSASATVPLAVAAAQRVTVGRVPQNDLCVAENGISRFHAWFEPRALTSGVEWLLTDGGSRNGTWVNALKLTPHTPVVVAPGSLVRFADVQMIFHLPSTFLRHLEAQMGSA